MLQTFISFELATITVSLTVAAPGLATTTTVSRARSVWRSKASSLCDVTVRKSPTRSARWALRSWISFFVQA